MKYLDMELRIKEQNHQDHECLYFPILGRGRVDRQVTQPPPQVMQQGPCKCSETLPDLQEIIVSDSFPD